MTTKLVSIVGTVLFAGQMGFGQSPGDLALARQLATESERQEAVEKIATSEQGKIPLLLAWTHTPPTGVQRTELYIGLANVFGRLRATEAIPFLIANISLHKEFEEPPWLKAAKVIQERLPAVGALVKIGPDASRAIIGTSWEHATKEDRLAAVFTVSQIKGVPEARGFSASALGEANTEKYWAEKGLNPEGEDH